ncbi:MAG: 30S ribosomal protein S20 [Endomicrobiales bacterium]|jgi:small subunit ribosomal protein S20
MAKLKTGRHTSALKENRKANKRAVRNTTIKSKIKTMAKKVEEAVKKNDSAAAQTMLKTAFSTWDKASKRHIIHDNAAANQKARLSKLVAGMK